MRRQKPASSLGPPDQTAWLPNEYGLLIALVAVLLIGVVTIFGSSIASWFANKTNSITSF